jgi:hypothetical protein
MGNKIHSAISEEKEIDFSAFSEIHQFGEMHYFV